MQINIVCLIFIAFVTPRCFGTSETGARRNLWVYERHAESFVRLYDAWIIKSFAIRKSISKTAGREFAILDHDMQSCERANIEESPKFEFTLDTSIGNAENLFLYLERSLFDGNDLFVGLFDPKTVFGFLFVCSTALDRCKFTILVLLKHSKMRSKLSKGLKKTVSAVIDGCNVSVAKQKKSLAIKVKTDNSDRSWYLYVQSTLNPTQVAFVGKSVSKSFNRNCYGLLKKAPPSNWRYVFARSKEANFHDPNHSLIELVASVEPQTALVLPEALLRVSVCDNCVVQRKELEYLQFLFLDREVPNSVQIRLFISPEAFELHTNIVDRFSSYATQTMFKLSFLNEFWTSASASDDSRPWILKVYNPDRHLDAFSSSKDLLALLQKYHVDDTVHLIRVTLENVNSKLDGAAVFQICTPIPRVDFGGLLDDSFSTLSTRSNFVFKEEIKAIELDVPADGDALYTLSFFLKDPSDKEKTGVFHLVMFLLLQSHGIAFMPLHPSDASSFQQRIIDITNQCNIVVRAGLAHAPCADAHQQDSADGWKFFTKKTSDNHPALYIYTAKATIFDSFPLFWPLPDKQLEIAFIKQGALGVVSGKDYGYELVISALCDDAFSATFLEIIGSCRKNSQRFDPDGAHWDQVIGIRAVTLDATSAMVVLWTAHEASSFFRQYINEKLPSAKVGSVQRKSPFFWENSLENGLWNYSVKRPDCTIDFGSFANFDDFFKYYLCNL